MPLLQDLDTVPANDTPQKQRAFEGRWCYLPLSSISGDGESVPWSVNTPRESELSSTSAFLGEHTLYQEIMGGNVQSSARMSHD
jgi:hypothetical protein